MNKSYIFFIALLLVGCASPVVDGVSGNVSGNESFSVDAGGVLDVTKNVASEQYSGVRDNWDLKTALIALGIGLVILFVAGGESKGVLWVVSLLLLAVLVFNAIS